MTRQHQHTEQIKGLEPKPARLLVFDGVCVLCSCLAKWIVRHDRHDSFRFATAQSRLGQSLLVAHGLRTDDFDSNLVLVDGKAYVRLDGLIAAADALGWPWRALRLLNLLPQGLKDRLYSLIASRRYALFGRKESCDIPDPELRARLLD